ncbi:uncharacterized protein Z520_05070 [Fonsecaea multimorphosa CBS 102226]|uniref:Uncharacterized protein n=1 Tax=Fonsecaea multimorphosa CBS 102226 TaxID=1442371 RepID=A0A0D2K8K5_9EURO|nr:uncharacterized protein Z520_05070 [Fonsecaea multimorphosa CBS 102226]KIX99494.1 hypothetical protein Z520_05070 [Fonsecaea multimorphosa CBS 102226]OAL25487.1 hypothetical protein AYO22_04806 [Fonsecaea multimorphosa]
MSTTTTTARKSAGDIIASASRPSNNRSGGSQEEANRNDYRRKLWCETQWTNLSMQAKKTHNLPTLPYFDPETMLLSKEVNARLWGQLGRLWDYLGPDRAPYATPIMVEGGEVKWHSFLNGSQGDEAEVYEKDLDVFMSRSKRPGEYDGLFG